ncbi:hypothetical protein J2W33_005343 [Variovorax boronicumulans]|nr:hypothetical protein [Variovorax boronicumulans]
MAKREPMMLVPQKLELTTQHAAALLNVSRPSVINEIEAGRLKCGLINRHRRIEFEERMRYKDDQKKRSGGAPKRLNDLSQEMGEELCVAASAQYTAVPDANVLYPALLRDVLSAYPDSTMKAACPRPHAEGQFSEAGGLFDIRCINCDWKKEGTVSYSWSEMPSSERMPVMAANVQVPVSAAILKLMRDIFAEARATSFGRPCKATVLR